MMAVMITDECIVCDACATECPVAAILDENNEKNPTDFKYYVKPESCVECVGHSDVPRCAEICPTEGAIVWDMPYIVDYEAYFMNANENKTYNIRVHNKKGLMLPSVKAQPYVESISTQQREAHENVSFF
jgi:ferredoxin